MLDYVRFSGYAEAMQGTAQIILARHDGAVIMQHRDNKPGITNPGLITAFGGNIEVGETPLEAATREINEETNIAVTPDRLQTFGTYHKTIAEHGENRIVYFFIIFGVDDQNLKVYEGQGFVIVRDIEELHNMHTSPIAKQAIEDYFRSLKNR
jgi:8-oxo-dGTP diphosphatase